MSKYINTHIFARSSFEVNGSIRSHRSPPGPGNGGEMLLVAVYSCAVLHREVEPGLWTSAPHLLAEPLGFPITVNCCGSPTEPQSSPGDQNSIMSSSSACRTFCEPRPVPSACILRIWEWNPYLSEAKIYNLSCSATGTLLAVLPKVPSSSAKHHQDYKWKEVAGSAWHL